MLINNFDNMKDFSEILEIVGDGTVYSDVFDFSRVKNITNVESTVNCTTISAGTLDITPQYSYDKATWFDLPTSFTQITGTSSETLEMTTTGLFVRFKCVVAGTTEDKATLSTSLTGSNNDIDYTAQDGGTQGNDITIAYVAGVAGDSLSVAVDNKAITVRLAMSAKVASSLSTALTGSNNDIDYTAVTPGTAGDGITIAYVDPSANNASLSIAVSGNAISIGLATNGSGAITTTAAQIISLVNGELESQKLVTASNKSGNDGTGVVTAMSATNLSGGGNGGSVTSTASSVRTAIANDADANALVATANKSGNDGTGVVTAMSATNLSGGGNNVELTINSIAK